MREGALSLVARNEQLAVIQSNYSAWSSDAEEYKVPSVDQNFMMHTTKKQQNKTSENIVTEYMLSHLNNDR